MTKTTLLRNTLPVILCIFMTLFTASVFAQVGIGTVTPDASSVLDVSSTTQGMLTPRMTTAQKNAIASPADGLMVYDTDLKAFYYYNQSVTAWTLINSATSGRLKFKRIKSTDVLATVLAAEKTAGGGTRYLLDTGTLYEISGTILLDLPIELNNCYITGLDSSDDKLVKTGGDLFTGTTGGSIRVLTLVSTGNVFNITGGGTQNLIFRDCIVANSANVGLIKDFSLVFVSIVQFVSNTTGIVYENISKLLISNAGWFGNNSGTYEKLVGTFGLVEKQGGFTEVNGTSIGFDVFTNPTITGDAVLETVVFTGTNTAGYVKGYTTGNYTGYNFNNSWNVRCAGIPTETDANAVGEFSVDYAVGSGAQTVFNTSNPSNTVKVQGVSTSTNLYRFSRGSAGGSDNKLQYLGKKKRFFQITGSISFQVTNPGTYIIYIALNGSPVTKYKIYGRGTVTSDIIVLPLNALIEMNTNDYVEIYAQRYTSTLTTDNMITPNMTLVVK